MLKFLRFRDLKAMGIVNNRVSLKNLQEKQGFPVGRLIGPNSRAWTEAEVAEWLDARPTASKAWNAPRAPKAVRAQEPVG